MANLTNGADWLEIYDVFLTATPNPNKPGKHYPLQGVVVPTPLDNYTIAVSATTAIPKPTWNLGAKVFPIITVVGSNIGNARINRDYSVLLGKTTIIKIDRFTEARYQLGIIIPSWFPDIHLSVWVYVGIESIKSTDERLESIEQDLAQIETKIDNYSVS